MWQPNASDRVCSVIRYIECLFGTNASMLCYSGKVLQPFSRWGDVGASVTSVVTVVTPPIGLADDIVHGIACINASHTRDVVSFRGGTLQLDEQLIRASMHLLERRRLSFVVNIDIATDSFNISLRPVADLISLLDAAVAKVLKVYDAAKAVPVVLSCTRPHSTTAWLNPVN